MKRSKRRPQVKHESALDKMLAHHLPTCTWHVYSGDRRCSCGRDAALAELAGLRSRLPLFERPSAPGVLLVGEAVGVRP
jgi:hypothetical protein